MPNLFGLPEPKTAILSECGRYRYQLGRVWDDSLPTAYWIMLNPSVADASIDDPTIRRCMAFARSWGCGSIDVRNLFAFRATEPADLLKATDPVGPENDAYLRALKNLSPSVVVAWGAHGDLFGRDDAVQALLCQHGIELACLGVTRSGRPRHPLYVKGDTPLRPLSGSYRQRK